jgi:hypothetical protein
MALELFFTSGGRLSPFDAMVVQIAKRKAFGILAFDKEILKVAGYG